MNRRALLVGAVAATIPALPAVASATDPLVALIDKHRAIVSNWPEAESEGRATCARLAEIHEEMAVTPPTTRAGALAGLTFLVGQMRDFIVDEAFLSAMITNCAGVLASA